MGTHRLAVVLALVAACSEGSTASDETASESGGETAADSLSMRGPGGPSGTLGEIRTVESGEVEAGGGGTTEARGRLIAESVVDRAGAREESIEGGRFAAASGFSIEGVPRGVRFLRVAVAPTVWEVVDRRGRRLALVSEEPWSRAADPGERPAGEIEQWRLLADDWGGDRVRIVVERFGDERFTYRVERLDGPGSAFLGAGWRSRAP
jgi:hypothetical protein